jgi:hypothetical protein
MCDLPPVVSAERASRKPPTCLREAGMPDRAPVEDPSQLAPPEPGLRHRLADRPTHDADTTATAIAATPTLQPTAPVIREKPVRLPTR